MCTYIIHYSHVLTLEQISDSMSPAGHVNYKTPCIVVYCVTLSKFITCTHMYLISNTSQSFKVKQVYIIMCSNLIGNTIINTKVITTINMRLRL